MVRANLIAALSALLNVTGCNSSHGPIDQYDAAFDAAFATLVFCSVASPAKALAELRRVVRSGGTVVLLEHVRPGGILGLLFDFLNLFTSTLFEDHINRRTAKTASEVGLEVVKVERSRLGIINLITCRV